MKKLIKLTAVLLSLALVVSVVPIVSAQAVVEPSETVIADEITQEESAYIIDEIIEKRTETTKHFLMSDGSVMAAVYDQAVHYNDGNAWVDIDNSFSINTDNELENTSNNFKTKFSKNHNHPSNGRFAQGLKAHKTDPRLKARAFSLFKP